MKMDLFVRFIWRALLEDGGITDVKIIESERTVRFNLGDCRYNIRLVRLRPEVIEVERVEGPYLVKDMTTLPVKEKILACIRDVQFRSDHLAKFDIVDAKKPVAKKSVAKAKIVTTKSQTINAPKKSIEKLKVTKSEILKMLNGAK